MKICRSCKEEKLLVEFYKSNSTMGGYRNDCKNCSKTLAKRCRENNLLLRRILSRRASLRCKYNLTDASITRLHNKEISYAICGQIPEKTLSVDHCHSTGIIRGFLCRNCNLGLGNFFDYPELLFSAIQYLTQREKIDAA